MEKSVLSGRGRASDVVYRRSSIATGLIVIAILWFGTCNTTDSCDGG